LGKLLALKLFGCISIFVAQIDFPVEVDVEYRNGEGCVNASAGGARREEERDKMNMAEHIVAPGAGTLPNMIMVD